MSEQSGGLDFIKRKLPHFGHRNSEKRRDEESEQIAREAIIFFANQEHQEPLATYPIDSESIFDINKQKPGAVIRLSWTGFEARQNFAWFVIGENNENGNDIYSVVVDKVPVGGRRAHEYFRKHYSEEQILKLGKQWSLEKVRSTKKSFRMEDAMKVLAENHDPLEYFVREIEKIDIMTVGRTVKKPLEQKSNPIQKLEPVGVII
jgi:hypothetical protein